jgi:D-amino-acid dehydrogenase
MRVVVIGAGAIGLCCAYYLAGAGAEVTVVDARQVGGGASRRNAGWVTPALSAPVPAPGVVGSALKWMLRRDSPLYVRPTLRPTFVRFMTAMLRNSTEERYATGLQHLVNLNLGTIDAFDELQRDGVSFEYHQSGLLSLFTVPAYLDHAAADSQQMQARGGTPAVARSAEWTQSHVPGVAARVIGALDAPAERFVDPNSFVDGLAAANRRLGVQLELDQRVQRVIPSPGSVEMVTAERAWTADHCVIAAGVWTRTLARTFGVRLALEAGKGYGFDLPANPAVPRALYLAEARVAITPLDSFTRVAGTMAFGGLDENVDARRARGILRSAESYFDPAAWPRSDGTERAWSGLRPMTPDGLPLIGRLPGQPSVTVATGHAMLGITLAPVTGRLVRDIVLDGALAADGPFSPVRRSVRAASTR